MKQYISGKTWGNVGTSSTDPADYPCFSPLRGHEWSNQTDAPDGQRFKMSHPWSVAGTFKHLYVEITKPEENPAGITWPDIDFELYINNAPTGLLVSVPGHAAGGATELYSTSGQNTTDTATIAPGDRVALARHAGAISLGFNNFSALIAWSLTFESDTDGESGYGVSSYGAGQLTDTNPLSAPPFNGTGGFSVGNDNTIGLTSEHSIVPLIGALTRLDVQLETAPGMGEHRTYAMVLNTIQQDGTGGTVDTQVTISNLSTTGFAEFTLPLAVLDRLSIRQLVSGGSPAPTRITASVALTATTDGQSALNFDAGGSNPITDGSTDYGSNGGWAWTTTAAPTPSSNPDRFPVSENFMSFPGPLDGFTLSSLCVNLSNSPGTDATRSFITRKAFADTAATLQMLDSDQLSVGSDGSANYFTPTDRIDLQQIASLTPTATASTIGWTWLVTESTTPPIVSTSYPIRRLRRFALPFDQNKWIFISRVELIMQAGNGLSGTAATVQGYNPIVMFRLSRDGGATWDDELQMATGKLGEYTARAYLNRLGRARNPVVELTSSDPVFVSWIDFTVDYEEGTS
jgi:hypothetical protein